MRDENRCAVCGAELEAAERGRPALYCSRSCQARAYRRRRQPPEPPPPESPTTQTRRRRQIVEAVWRIAATRGLDAASMREIAAEAGTSLRVVQYHFASKHALLVAALRTLNADNERRTQDQIAAHREPLPPRDLLRLILDAFLPLDDVRRRNLLVYTAYYARSLTDQALAAVFLGDEQPLEEFVAAILAQAGLDGIDPKLEADLLVSGVSGLGLDILHERRTVATARRVIDYHLDRLFGAGPAVSSFSTS